MADTEVLKHLAFPVVYLGLLLWAADYAPHPPAGTILGAVRWCAAVMLLHVFYSTAYECLRLCRCCAGGARRGYGLSTWGQSPRQLQDSLYTDLPQMPPAGEGSPPEQMELSPASVYTYVYGWGVLLFVCLYCAAGQNESSSCWWVVGMLVLAFDELIARNVERLWVGVIGALLYCSVVSLWWDASGSKAVEQHLDAIILGVVFPVLAPFIFFSLRSPVRVVLRDVRALYNTAMPFIAIISLGVLVGTSHAGEPPVALGRVARGLGGGANATGALETAASFQSHNQTTPPPTYWHQLFLLPYAPLDPEGAAWLRESLLRPLALLVTPFIAERVITTLVESVMRGFVTEFLTSFMLTLSVKYAITHDAGPASELSIAAAGTCFVMLVLLRRVI